MHPNCQILLGFWYVVRPSVACIAHSLVTDIILCLLICCCITKAVVLHPEYYASQRSPTKLPRMPSLAMEYAGPNSQFLCHPIPSIKMNSRQKNVDGDFLSEYEIKYFLYNLLVALDALHSKGMLSVAIF